MILIFMKLIKLTAIFSKIKICRNLKNYKLILQIDF